MNRPVENSLVPSYRGSGKLLRMCEVLVVPEGRERCGLNELKPSLMESDLITTIRAYAVKWCATQFSVGHSNLRLCVSPVAGLMTEVEHKSKSA